MTIYVLSSVKQKEYEYVEFLMKSCGYNSVEAGTRYWEIEYQIIQHCNPILMKAGTHGTIKFKSVLQRQEIGMFANNRSQLMKIIKRRKGNKGNTQWNIDYIVSNQGNVYITAIKCNNSLFESLTHQCLKQQMNDCVRLRKIMEENAKTLDESEPKRRYKPIQQPEIIENKQYNTMKNKRNRVVLTESQLNSMIAESVRQVLSEIDWKTYAHAAKKAREEGRDSRWDFDRATEKALDQKYGGHHSVSTDSDTYQRFHTYNDDPFSLDYDCAWRPLKGHEDFGIYADRHDSKKPYGNEEIADFVNGNYEYQKGKGWQLK